MTPLAAARPIPLLAGDIIKLARSAGRKILEIYGEEFTVEIKADNSPLTEADKAANEVITQGLAKLTPDIPLLSEEGRDIGYEERANWPLLWIVDPLDGTKEFIKRNGEFTVNIALVENGRTVWGVVDAPYLGRTYWGGGEFGSFSQEGGQEGDAPPVPLKVLPPGRGGVTVVKSRSHPSRELARFLTGFMAHLKVADEVAVGSSLKFCAIAEGRAHIYPRLGPTMEWDTAAGQAVLEGAGGRVVTPEGEPFRYNKPELLNGYFIADCNLEW